MIAPYSIEHLHLELFSMVLGCSITEKGEKAESFQFGRLSEEVFDLSSPLPHHLYPAYVLILASNLVIPQ